MGEHQRRRDNVRTSESGARCASLGTSLAAMQRAALLPVRGQSQSSVIITHVADLGPSLHGNLPAPCMQTATVAASELYDHGSAASSGT